MAPGRSEFRALPSSLAAGDIVSTHVSVNYDRTGFIRDADTAFPVERLRELAGEGAIGSVADTHYAVMGSNDPAGWGPMADEIAAALRADSVDAVLFSPV
ncbi:MAG: hypothetical protein IPK81_19440 [Rhodospirillales bacterium]|nr:MAG: hypothetical protein IPK81_19440 [Rhodospirillales bacterium]